MRLSRRRPFVPSFHFQFPTNGASPLGLLYITFSPNSNEQRSEGLYAIEVWIVISFCLGGTFTGWVNDNDDNVSRPVTFATYKASAFGQLISLALGAAIYFYVIWFLFVGMDGMLAPPCSRTAFFFARVDLYHWFRTFLKVTFVIASALVGIYVVFYVFFVVPVSIHKSGCAPFLKGLFSAPGAGDDVQEETPAKFYWNVSFAITPLISLIVATELLVRWNHIEGVGAVKGTGQLLPIILAGGGFVRVCWRIITYALAGKYSSSSGRGVGKE